MQYGRTRTMSDRDRKADEDEAARKSYLETATGRLIEQLKTEDRELKNLQKSLANVDSLSKSTGISVERLTESLKEQIDAILERSNAGVDIAKTLQDEQKQFNQINDLLRSENGVQDLADQYGISADTLARSLRESRRGFDDLYRESATMTDLITDQWDEMSKNMASSITKGIMEGKGAFNSLADFLKDFSKRVIEQIIEKMLIQPMIDQMTNWMGMTNKVVPTLASQMQGLGGMGGGMGGGGLLGGLMSGLGGLFKPMQGPMMPGMGGGLFSGLGGMFSGLWSGISGFFGNLFGGFFADGGYLPANKIGVVGEAGPEIISGPANITPMNGGGEPVVVNFNINAIDTQTGTEFILRNKKQITGVIQDAYNRRGKQGVY